MTRKTVVVVTVAVCLVGLIGAALEAQAQSDGLALSEQKHAIRVGLTLPVLPRLDPPFRCICAPTDRGGIFSRADGPTGVPPWATRLDRGGHRGGRGGAAGIPGTQAMGERGREWCGSRRDHRSSRGGRRRLHRIE
jgi:hypothetical protein